MRISFLLLRLIKRFRHFNHLFFLGGGMEGIGLMMFQNKEKGRKDRKKE